jgi:hypothetical protein
VGLHWFKLDYFGLRYVGLVWVVLGEDGLCCVTLVEVRLL